MLDVTPPRQIFRTMWLAAAATVFCMIAVNRVDAQTILEKQFDVRTDGESLLEIRAYAPGTSWGQKGREAAVVTIYVDRRYSQDVILFGGSRLFTYRVILGRLNKGKHYVRLELNRSLSARGVTSVSVKSVRFDAIDRSNPEHDAIASSPFLYARTNSIGRFSDIPLLMWYEADNGAEAVTTRYSVIFSNEDGGTRTDALMARWGRATDIEWVYELKRDRSGRVIAETYQGVNHLVREFRGRKEGNHPALFVASDNNNFSDVGESTVRMALMPIRFSPVGRSREELMDRHPWTYRVMAEELLREGKVLAPAPPASALGSDVLSGPQIADPRLYLYIEAGCLQRGTTLTFRVRLKGDPTWYSSDLGQSRFRIDRTGYFRTTVRLPDRVGLDRIERIAVHCDSVQLGTGPCVVLGVNKIFLLDNNFVPGPALAVKIRPVSIEPGRGLEIYRR